MGPIWSVVHLTLEQLRARTLTLPVVEISHLTLLSPYLQFCVPDSTNHRLCGSTVLFSGKKKNPCISGPMQFKLMLFKGQLYKDLTEQLAGLGTEDSVSRTVGVKRGEGRDGKARAQCPWTRCAQKPVGGG